MAEKTDFSLGNFETVVVTKTDLLNKLEQNRDKHNALYDAAVSGYWLEAQKVVDKRKTEFAEAIVKVENKFKYELAEVQAGVTAKDTSKRTTFGLYLEYQNAWPLKYPVSHLEDYQRIIDMLKFSVADKIELSMTDFDCYVRNNWSWKKEFVASNFNYVSGYAMARQDVNQFGQLARIDDIVTEFANDSSKF